MPDHLDEIISDGAAPDPEQTPGRGGSVDASEEDPDASVTATLPGYSAAGAGEGHVGPASSDHP